MSPSGYCADCDRERPLDRHGACASCGSEAVLVRGAREALWDRLRASSPGWQYPAGWRL